MNSHTIDAKTFQKLFLAGANRINSRKDYINELNVFPAREPISFDNKSREKPPIASLSVLPGMRCRNSSRISQEAVPKRQILKNNLLINNIFFLIEQSL